MKTSKEREREKVKVKRSHDTDEVLLEHFNYSIFIQCIPGKKIYNLFNHILSPACLFTTVAFVAMAPSDQQHGCGKTC